MYNKIYKFNSGLTLLYCKNTINNATRLNIAFDCGARCDGELAGLSHFCEHMFFTGTDKFSKNEISKKYFDFIHANAFTSNLDIEFEGEVLTDKLTEYLDTVAEMIVNSTFKKQAVEDEKKIIIQEIVQDYNKSEKTAWILFNNEAYGKAYSKLGVLGTEGTVSKIQSADIKKYVKKYFVKNNCYVYICSPLSFNKVKNIVRQHFERVLPSNNLKPLSYREDECLQQDKLVVYTNTDIQKNHLKICLKLDAGITDVRQEVICNTIRSILNDNDELFKIVRLDNSLVYGISCSDNSTDKSYTFIVNTTTSKENIKACIDKILEYLKNIKYNGFTQTQLDKVKMRKDYYYQTRIVTPSSKLEELYSYRNYQQFATDDMKFKLVQTITLKELNEQAKNLFNNSKMIVFVYGDVNKKEVYTLKQIQNKLK